MSFTRPSQRPVHSTVDVYLVRWIDGYRIEAHHRRLSNQEAEDLRMVESILPGELAAFIKTPSPRPWQRPPAVAS